MTQSASLVEIIACRLFVVKPLSETMTVCCECIVGNKSQNNFNQLCNNFIEENAFKMFPFFSHPQCINIYHCTGIYAIETFMITFVYLFRQTTPETAIMIAGPLEWCVFIQPEQEEWKSAGVALSSRALCWRLHCSEPCFWEVILELCWQWLQARLSWYSRRPNCTEVYWWHPQASCWTTHWQSCVGR